MSRVDGPGGPKQPEGLPPIKEQKKKKKGAKSFGDVLQDKKGAGEAANTEGAKTTKQGQQGMKVNEQPGKTGKQGRQPADGASANEAKSKFTLDQEGVKGARELKQTQKSEVDKSKSLGEEAAQGIQQQTQQTGAVQGEMQVQETKPAGLPPELVQKLVETVRVGQNRVGATEMQLGLKSTVFEGMNLKVSSKDGLVNVVMEVEQMVARDQLESQIESLQERLQDQGLAVGDISVELKGSGSGAGGGSGEDSGGQGTEGPGESGPAAGGTEPPGSVEKGPETSTDYSL